MLDKAAITVLEYLSGGHSHKKVADILNIDHAEYLKLYCNILITTKCWDDMELGIWWQKNREQYFAYSAENVTSLSLVT